MGDAPVDVGTEDVRMGTGRERRRQGLEGIRLRTAGREHGGAQGTEHRGRAGRHVIIFFRIRRHDSRGGIVLRWGEEKEGRDAGDGGWVIVIGVSGFSECARLALIFQGACVRV